MALTRTELRQRLGIELRGFRTSLAGLTSTRNTVVDPTYPYRANRPDGAYTDFTDWWLWRPRAVIPDDQERRVLNYDPRTGTYTPDVGYTNAPGLLEPYELWNCGLALDEVHDAINQSLRRVRVTDRFWLTPPVDAGRVGFERLALPLDVQQWCTNAQWIENVAVAGPLVGQPLALTAQLPTAGTAPSVGMIATFRRDRQLGTITRVQAVSATPQIVNQFTLTPVQSPTPNHLGVLVVTSGTGSSVLPPAAYQLLAIVQTSGLTTRLFAAPLNGTEGPIVIGGDFVSNAIATWVEYHGLRADGYDRAATSVGAGAALASGTTTATAEGDELAVGVLACATRGAYSAPSGRFQQVVLQPGVAGLSHAVYERNCLQTSLEDQPLVQITGRVHEPAVEEGGVVYLWPDRAVSAGSAYVVQARRPLAAFCRVDASGTLGAKLDGLDGEDQQTNGGVNDELLDLIVAGALTYAYERYPTFRELAEGDRLQRIQQARMRFLAFERAAQLPRQRAFRERERVG